MHGALNALLAPADALAAGHEVVVEAGAVAVGVGIVGRAQVVNGVVLALRGAVIGGGVERGGLAGRVGVVVAGSARDVAGLLLDDRRGDGLREEEEGASGENVEELAGERRISWRSTQGFPWSGKREGIRRRVAKGETYLHFCLAV
jgi:hypothetical protein